MPPLSFSEQQKWEVVTQTLNQAITNETAAKKLRLSIRQIQRLKIQIRKCGVSAVVHHLKGKPSNHRLRGETKQKALCLVTQNYPDFKPKFAAEKLAEEHRLQVHPETLRLWMVENQLWKVKRQRKPDYHCWRERKAHFGELQQFDGSYHPWLENRLQDESGNPVELCLLAAIDDATGQITQAEFAMHEGVIPVFSFWKKYVEHQGKPGGIYLDKYSTYKINYPGATDNSELMTQFQQAMHRLDIRLICANSPQAKGRVERLFGTLQDRLVKELRLGGINTVAQANQFLSQTFISKFNQQFAVRPEKEGDVHVPLTNSEKQQLRSIFSLKSIRRVNPDFTLQFKNHFYQLKEIQPVTVRPREEIVVEEWLDQTLHLKFRNQELNFFLLPGKPQKVSASQPAILTTHRLNWKPPANHPWLSFNFSHRKG
ncbi:MAG: ISNCY family transposase [Bdellovibrionota bacterium]